MATPFVTENTLKRLSWVTGLGSAMPRVPAATFATHSPR